MAIGRYPLKSSWGFNKANKSGRTSILRTEVRDTRSNNTMWQNWFLGADGIGFGIIKRWNGTSWVVAQNIKVHAF